MTRIAPVLIGAALLATVAACSRETPAAPTSPSGPSTPAPPPGPQSSAPVHDTLNPSGSPTSSDGAWSELSGGDDRQIFDDFVSPVTTSIRTVRWQGNRPTTRRPTRFYLSFIADGGGFPLRLPNSSSTRPRALSEATFTIDQVNERLVTTAACLLELCGSYEYSVALPAAFATTAGTRYWLLIQAESPLGSLSGWSWRKGLPDNLFSTSNIAGHTAPWDFAFSLLP